MLLSLFTFGMAYDTPFGRTLDGKEVSWKKQLKDGYRGAVSQGKGFGAVGAAYAVSECIIESVSLGICLPFPPPLLLLCVCGYRTSAREN